ncbi:class I SAM-dependent methyltransferase [Amycolatopsis saalfeldensis]|uniref:Methyltransferase domain-containing protein n=1 Tax=Amycolatopsis saalfeldensis TaxID=394193 RepID=A0A1H8QQ33_9PSEU|nr:class I SAM-dependent methyltransferase [Amycolatopsis saalfeldensis]SEO56101.1 Methyltransferase domain-containing protein [Amycolatopsis saalfeldensis]
MDHQREDRLTARTLGGALRRKAGTVLRRAAARLHDPYTDQLNGMQDQLGRMREELRAEIVQQGDRLLDRVVEFEIRSRRDIVYAGDQDAALESNIFARESLVGAKHFGSPPETLKFALSLAPTGGMALEFGVASGNTLRTIAGARGGVEVYGFDSFEGLPEAWLNGMPAGAFARDDLPDVPGAELVVGLFADSLPGFLEKHQGHVDFLHVDGDLYSSAKTVLDLVGPRLRPGSIVHFDEFFNFPGWKRHEYRAWMEHIEKTGVEFTYEAYTYNDNQVTVRITGVPGLDRPAAEDVSRSTPAR